MRESQKSFSTLANNISQLAWMADEKGYIFWYNDRWFDYTGTTLEEMINNVKKKKKKKKKKKRESEREKKKKK